MRQIRIPEVFKDKGLWGWVQKKSSEQEMESCLSVVVLGSRSAIFPAPLACKNFQRRREPRFVCTHLAFPFNVGRGSTETEN